MRFADMATTEQPWFLNQSKDGILETALKISPLNTYT